MNISISLGNDKLGRIPSFSLPPILTCQGKCQGCYAIKLARIYPNVDKAWRRNLHCVNTRLADTFKEISDYLAANPKVKLFRVHVSGDFKVKHQNAYILGWKLLAKKFPGVSFLAFTKIAGLADRFASVPNFTIRFSYWEHSVESESGPVSLVQEVYQDSIPADAIHCRNQASPKHPTCDKCQLCWNRKVKAIVFNKH